MELVFVVLVAVSVVLITLWLITRHSRVEPIRPASPFLVPRSDVSDPPNEPVWDDIETELFDQLQRAEYRIPYEIPVRWPLLECPHDDVIEVHEMSQAEPVASWCVVCGHPGIHTHLVDGRPVDQYGEPYDPPRRPPTTLTGDGTADNPYVIR